MPRDSRGRKHVTAWLKLLVSTLLLGLLLWRTPLTEVLAHLHNLRLATLLICAGLALASWALSALRLWCLLPGVAYAIVLRNTFTSMLYAAVLPGPIAGDLVKAYRLGRTAQQRGHAEAATFVDRGIALFALFFLSAIAAPMSAGIPPLLCGFFVGGVAVMAAVGLLFASKGFRRLVEAKCAAGTARTFLRHFAIAMHDCLRRPMRMLLAFILALAFHAMCVLIQVILAVDLGIAVDWIDWIAIYAGVSLITLMPFSIAGIGLREGGFVGLLYLFGIGSSMALSQSFATFALSLFGATCGGLLEVCDAWRTRNTARAGADGNSAAP